MLTMIMMMNLNRLFVSYRHWVRCCHRYRDVYTHWNFDTDWDVDGHFYSYWNSNRNLNGDVLDDWDSNGNRLRYSVGLGNGYWLGHGVRYSVGLRNGDGCRNWIGNSVAFAKCFFKTFSVMVGSGGDFIRIFPLNSLAIYNVALLSVRPTVDRSLRSNRAD